MAFLCSNVVTVQTSSHFTAHVHGILKESLESSNAPTVSPTSVWRNTETVGASILTDSLPVMSMFMFYHLFYIV